MQIRKIINLPGNTVQKIANNIMLVWEYSEICKLYKR